MWETPNSFPCFAIPKWERFTFCVEHNACSEQKCRVIPTDAGAIIWLLNALTVQSLYYAGVL
jgi:hypothetical protein